MWIAMGTGCLCSVCFCVERWHVCVHCSLTGDWDYLFTRSSSESTAWNGKKARLGENPNKTKQRRLSASRPQFFGLCVCVCVDISHTSSGLDEQVSMRPGYLPVRMTIRNQMRNNEDESPLEKERTALAKACLPPPGIEKLNLCETATKRPSE